MPISKRKVNGYSIYINESNMDISALMHKYFNNEIQGARLNSGHELRTVELIEFNSKKFILKNDKEIDVRLEKRIQSIIFGSFYSRLMKKLYSLRKDQRACTPQLYYVAEKVKFRQCVDVYALYEYIEGTPLKAIDRENSYRVKQCITDLHQVGLASNDIHPDNFIQTRNDEIKVIDLSFKGSLKVCQANDIYTLRNKYGINFSGKGVVFHLISTKEKLKKLSRRLRGK